MELSHTGKATVHEVFVKLVEARYTNHLENFPACASAPGIAGRNNPYDPARDKSGRLPLGIVMYLLRGAV